MRSLPCKHPRAEPGRGTGSEAPIVSFLKLLSLALGLERLKLDSGYDLPAVVPSIDERRMGDKDLS